MNQLTQEQTVRFAKEISTRQEKNPVTLVDFDGKYSFASDDEVSKAASIVKRDFQKTITELANR